MTTRVRLASMLHQLSPSRFFPKADQAVNREAEPVTKLFGAEQMEKHGAMLASSHRVRTRPVKDRLLARLDDNESLLRGCCAMLSSASAGTVASPHIAPAGEWLLENYWVIEEQILTARRHLPKGYSKGLPKLGDGASEGLPRVYDIAMELITHGDGALDVKNLHRFVAAYQTIHPLALGELWAVPIMLRLALIENLRRVSSRVVDSWRAQRLAGEWADRLIETAAGGRKGMLQAVAALAASNPPISGAFVAVFSRRLQGQGPLLALPLSWMEDVLAEENLDVARLVRQDAREQAGDKVSISNSVASLRALSGVDWQRFVEDLSQVEQTLRHDPAAVYAHMDFSTRDGYRHVVESLAKLYGTPEEKVASLAIDLAKNAYAAAAPESAEPAASDKTLPGRIFPDRIFPGQALPGQTHAAGVPLFPVSAHVGYYLVDGGLHALQAKLQEAGGADGTGEPQPDARLFSAGRRNLPRTDRQLSLAWYLGISFFVSLLIAWPFIAMLRQSGWHGPLLVLAAVPLLLVAIQAAVKLVNWPVMLCITPRLLPRLDYAEGIPAEARTLAVIPCMVGNESDVTNLLATIEVHYLATRAGSGDHIQFGLLADFTDSARETEECDAELARRMTDGIERLNRIYSGTGPDAGSDAGPDAGTGVDSFFLCLRPRRWNESEGIWMGYERKRGKLMEFNALLTVSDTAADEKARSRFAVIAGNTLSFTDGASAPVRYVITLDTDTRLPRDAARKLAGAMAHPLNRPVFDLAVKRVVAGYAILQPGIGMTLPHENRTGFAKLFVSDAGIDPYTRSVSDLYQDLFGQGSYIGKGIYDVAAFELAVKDRFPENRILSHDLLEGCYARSGLVSDVQLYEEYPSGYSADVKRRYRWMRGDWQLLPRILPKVRDRHGALEPNPLSALSRWKLADNLGRSLVPLSLLALFCIGWLAVTATVVWTLALLGLVFAMPVLEAAQSSLRRPRDSSWKGHLAETAHALQEQGLRTGMMLLWLPHEAAYSMDAVLRTLWRLLVSKQHLLQWDHSSNAEQSAADSYAGHYRLMAASPLCALAIAVALTGSPAALAVAAPFIIAWLASPALTCRLGKPEEPARFLPSPAQERFLRTLARKTWAFFDTYVSAENNWLPPDNMQEDPKTAVAARTSPTNMGLALLARLAAFDFGYAGAGVTLEKTEKSLRAMAGLERFHGHFYNWYDIQTLQVLPPSYISTVDSGNLAAHLMTLRHGLLDLADAPVYSERRLAGIADTAAIVAGHLGEENTKRSEWQRLVNTLDDFAATGFVGLQQAASAARALRGWSKEAFAASAPVLGTDESFWFESLVAQCADLVDELELFMLPGDALRQLGLAAFPRMREMASLEPGLLPDSMKALALTVRGRAEKHVAQAERLAELAADMAEEMDFSFLLDKGRGLLSIGYSVQEHRLDQSCYDLLASEARLAYFTAIAQGQIPQKSWYSLSRMLVGGKKDPALLSWSGSMFEYLMPILVMPNVAGTLLEVTCKGAVARQIEYGRNLGLPWGVSESGYNLRDGAFNYQYRAFGVPGLGLRRGLDDDVVVAPYASALALMVEPESACENMQLLAGKGFSGRFGLYEAVDYTALRLPRNRDAAVVYSFMAHHQGMTLLSLAGVLLDRPMQRRFQAEPSFQSAMALLEEKMPRTGGDRLAAFQRMDVGKRRSVPGRSENALRIFKTPGNAHPAVQLLSNGNYHVMVSSAGGGYSRYRDLAVTRWREDPTCDGWGTFCYLRDQASGDFWSATHQPVCGPVDAYEALFSDARAEFRVRRNGFDAHTEIVVSPEDDVELRRLTLTNMTGKRRVIELTSYAEIVLAPQAADEQHPAFSNLFVQTRIEKSLQAVVCARRPRSKEESGAHMFHLLAAHGVAIDAVSYETDRNRFIGRGRSLGNPAAMAPPAGAGGSGAFPGALSNTEGAVLDPIVSIRCSLTLEPGQVAVLDLVSGFDATYEGCLGLIEKFRDNGLADRVFDMAWTHGRILLHQSNATVPDAQMFEHLAASILYANPTLRADPMDLKANSQGQLGLWRQSISGDYPIVLLKISDSTNAELATQLVKAHTYWRMKGLATDLVIWNEDPVTSYRQNLKDMILSLIPSVSDGSVMDRPGGIFIRSARQLSREDRILIQAAARVIISDQNGSLCEQIYRQRPISVMPGLAPNRTSPVNSAHDKTAMPESRSASGLLLANHLGGFSTDGSEYIISLNEGDATPLPWVNVLANQAFGTVVSESGSAYTWAENAHEFRLTPWANDPVKDAGGEALYIRDETSGEYWSPTPWPVRGRGAYTVRHGFGSTVFEHVEDGIESELAQFVARKAAMKFFLLKLRNTSGRMRRLSVTGYVEWVLGDVRAKSAMHIVAESDPGSGALLAQNAFSTDFGGRSAVFDCSVPARSTTCDRAEFIGRNGSLHAPAALSRARLSGRNGPGSDPCGAMQASIILRDGESRTITFMLGAAETPEDALALARIYRENGTAEAELDDVRQYWNGILGTTRVRTPDPAVNVMVNGWLLYQTIACRYLARSGFYQSGGAYGFRDQLQDSMAMVHAAPGMARRHLLRSAARQFVEGDVLHWWHPPTGRGVRTRCSDDYLWLPLAVVRYVRATGDGEVLDSRVEYLQGRPLGEAEESLYDLFETADVSEPLYAHCARAIRHGLRFGVNGLPLMGGGDWNDGMDKVGSQGRGESVWLGFFLHHVLSSFAPVAEQRGDRAFAAFCREQADQVRVNLQLHGWDGAWYRRAYFDDGEPLGSAGNDECRIDSIAQSWSVLSGAAPDDRRRIAMRSLDTRLVRRDLGLVQLLDPPFDRSAQEPGYIKGYVPGVRENGGQYTHAAVWAAMAFAELGDAARAWELAGMINPVRHGDSERAVDIYKVEPYVLVADVYAAAPHEGRGGWSWYTGAAGWMYRLLVESLLGLCVEGDRLTLKPLLPESWPEVTIFHQYKETPYTITIRGKTADAGTGSVSEGLMDGVCQSMPFLLVNDGQEHIIEVNLV